MSKKFAKNVAGKNAESAQMKMASGGVSVTSS